MRTRLYILLVGMLASVAAGGVIVSTTRDLGSLTVLEIPDWFQLPGVILVGILVGLACRNSIEAFVALAIATVLGGVLQGFAIAISAAGAERASVQLINRGTVQGFYALMVIFFFGMIGVVIAAGINLAAHRVELQE